LRDRRRGQPHLAHPHRLNHPGRRHRAALNENRRHLAAAPKKIGRIDADSRQLNTGRPGSTRPLWALDSPSTSTLPAVARPPGRETTREPLERAHDHPRGWERIHVSVSTVRLRRAACSESLVFRPPPSRGPDCGRYGSCRQSLAVRICCGCAAHTRQRRAHDRRESVEPGGGWCRCFGLLY
jgi:hypothetical protein